MLYRSVFELLRELQAEPTLADTHRKLTRSLRPELLCLDDFGMKRIPPEGVERLLRIFVLQGPNVFDLQQNLYGLPMSKIQININQDPINQCFQEFFAQRRASHSEYHSVAEENHHYSAH